MWFFMAINLIDFDESFNKSRAKGLAIAVLHNPVTPDSPEDMKDVLVQAEWVGELVTALGCQAKNVILDPADSDLARKLVNAGDVVFNLVDSSSAEPAAAYWAVSFLERLEKPFTGSGLEAMVLTTDKIHAKVVLRQAGLTTADWVSARDARAFKSGVSYLVKPIREDASIGISQNSVTKPESLEELLSVLAQKEIESGNACFAEVFLPGRELDVPLLETESGVVALTPVELFFKGFSEAGLCEIYSYEAKWGGNLMEYDGVQMHLSQDQELNQQLQSMACKAWDLFGLRGYGKVDFRLDAQGIPHILEINCNPSLYLFWPHHQAGLLSMADVIDTIIHAAGSRQLYENQI
ncbi:MAG: hypothetical protein EOM08_07030 [Clostridia bacterium]|nr:hypothetical protein [Clostridia bacterium]